MATPDKDPTADTAASPAKPRKRHWLWRLLRGVTIFTLILLALNFAVSFLYHGPNTLPAIVAVMPGVPIFPLAQVSPGNPRAQRAMALPLWFMRLQGAKHAEAAQILAPADGYFIAYWYRQSASQLGWQLAGEEKLGGGRRLVFLREHEGLQVIIGKTRDILTPVQLIYLSGMADAQREQLASGLPKETDADFPPSPEHTATKPATPPTVPPTVTPTVPTTSAPATTPPAPTGTTPPPAQLSTPVPAAARPSPTPTSKQPAARRTTSTARPHHRTPPTTRRERNTIHRRTPATPSRPHVTPTPQPSTPSYRKPTDGKVIAPRPTEDAPSSPDDK